MKIDMKNEFDCKKAEKLLTSDWHTKESLMKKPLMNFKRLEKEIEDWKERGAVSTPLHIIEFMIDEIARPSENDMILDAGCGFGNFFYTLEKKGYRNIEGIELNEKVAPKDARIIVGDFLLYNFQKIYDLVIGNPPYGIPAVANHYPIKIDESLKRQYRNRSETWKGKYNLYALFIERAVKISRKTCFIVPSTWILLEDFTKLRRFLSINGKTSFYHLGRKVFESVHVDVGIILHERDKPQNTFELYSVDENFRVIPIRKISWHGEPVCFAQDDLRGISLKELFDICMSIRSCFLSKYEGDEIHYMKGRNVLPGKLDRTDYLKKKTKFLYIQKMKKEYGIVPRIVMRHTAPYPICAVETEIWPYVGDVYHLVPKRKMSYETMNRICEYLNSVETRKRFYMLYRNIIPHVMKWQLNIFEIPRSLLDVDDESDKSGKYKK